MEKNRIIWHSSRPLLGLICWGIITACTLDAKEVFNASFPCASQGFDYGSVETVSFFFSGEEKMNVDAMVKSLVKEKADVVITGENSIEGAALSPSISTYITFQRNNEEKSCLVTITSYVSALATKAKSVDGDPYRGGIMISGYTLVFVDPITPKEMERAISDHLQQSIDKIISSRKTKPKFFVVH